MQKNAPTDVLSFPIFSNESLNNLDHIELGDIFISLEMAMHNLMNINIQSIERCSGWLVMDFYIF